MIHPQIYECDKCHNKQEDHEQFWFLTVHAKWAQNNSSRPVGHSYDVCRNCLEDLGIFQQKTQDTQSPEPPTVEELIREIIQRCTEE